MISTEVETTSKKRGPYAVSARLQRALTALASGEAKTQIEAAELAGMTARALRLAMKRDSVRAWMKQEIMSSLGVSAFKAAARLDELLRSPNQMVSFRSVQLALGVGAGIVTPAAGSTTVNVLATGTGYTIDLRPAAEKDTPVGPADAAALSEVGGVLLGSRRAGAESGPVLELAASSARRDE